MTVASGAGLRFVLQLFFQEVEAPRVFLFSSGLPSSTRLFFSWGVLVASTDCQAPTMRALRPRYGRGAAVVAGAGASISFSRTMGHQTLRRAGVDARPLYPEISGRGSRTPPGARQRSKIDGTIGNERRR